MVNRAGLFSCLFFVSSFFYCATELVLVSAHQVSRIWPQHSWPWPQRTSPTLFFPWQTSCPITNTIQLAWRVRVSSSKLFPFHVVTLQLCNRGNTRQFFFWIYKLVVFCHPLAHGCITMQEFSPIFVEIQESKQVWIIATLFCRFCLSFRCYEEIGIF